MGRLSVSMETIIANLLRYGKRRETIALAKEKRSRRTKEPKMTATKTRTTGRAFGKCAVKGCKYVHVTALELDYNSNGLDEGYRYVRDADGARYIAQPYSLKAVKAMAAAGLACPQHGGTMTYVGTKATYNPEKVCDGRCMNAKRPNCDCSCSGENHGKFAV
jgi:hypothetical protein